MKVTHGLCCRHVDAAGVEREIQFDLLEDKSMYIAFSTKWSSDEKPVCTPLRLTPVAAELLAEGMFQLAHHRDAWKMPADKGEEP